MDSFFDRCNNCCRLWQQNFLVRMIIYQLQQKKFKSRILFTRLMRVVSYSQREEVQITSMVSGWITEITVVEGDTVNPDQHLISIDQKQYQAAYDQAASQVKSSEANLKNIKSQMARTESLFSQKLISKQELEQIEASYQLARVQGRTSQGSLNI